MFRDEYKNVKMFVQECKKSVAEITGKKCANYWIKMSRSSLALALRPSYTTTIGMSGDRNYDLAAEERRNPRKERARWARKTRRGGREEREDWKA